MSSATYSEIISLDNLFTAWQEFVRGKRTKVDVCEFHFNLASNIFTLHDDLRRKQYRHGDYKAFSINDPKPRNIHKATVRDRLVHHAIYRVLYPLYDRTFISDSYSCRKCKGTHQALETFHTYARKVSNNDTRTCWVLKCDIRKFFASIDHTTLLSILRHRIIDDDIVWLLDEVVSSFHATAPNKGLPLGNLTSQLLANVYMNEFDQFVKHKLKAKHYIRYADDFVFLSHDRKLLVHILPYVDSYLKEHLKLVLHPSKVHIRTVASGVDFLGWVHFPAHRVLRTSTKRRMFAKVSQHQKEETVHSYIGLLQHGNTHKLLEQLQTMSQTNTPAPLTATGVW